jgi:hypothetical protein
MIKPFKKSSSYSNLTCAALEAHNLAIKEHEPLACNKYEILNASPHEPQKKVPTGSFYEDSTQSSYESDAYDDCDGESTKTHKAHTRASTHTSQSTHTSKNPHVCPNAHTSANAHNSLNNSLADHTGAIEDAEDNKLLLSYFSADEPLALSLSSHTPEQTLTHNQQLSPPLSPPTQNTWLKDNNLADSRPPTPHNPSPAAQELSPCEDPLLLNIINKSALVLTLQIEYAQRWPRFTMQPNNLLRKKLLRTDLSHLSMPAPSLPHPNIPRPSLPPQNPYVYATVSPCVSVYKTLVRTQQKGHLKQLAGILLFLGNGPFLTVSSEKPTHCLSPDKKKSLTITEQEQTEYRLHNGNLPVLTITGKECAEHSFINLETSAENVCRKTLYK